MLERRHVMNHCGLPISGALLQAAKHAFARCTTRWKQLSAPESWEAAELGARFPCLRDPLNGVIDRATRGSYRLTGDVDQLCMFMHSLLGVHLNQRQLNQIWQEADLDNSDTLFFGEVVCLLSPAYTSVSLRTSITELQDPQRHFLDPGPPLGFCDG